MGSQPTYADLQAALVNETARAERLADRVCKMDRELIETRTREWTANEALLKLRAWFAPEESKDEAEQVAIIDAALAEKPGVFQTAALAACAYLTAHAALVDVYMTPERPEAARRRADAWIALTKACEEIQPVGGPAQDGAGAALPRSGIPLLDHAFVPNTWAAVDACDKRVSDPGSQISRQCGRPRKEHPAEEVKPERRK